MPAEPIAKGARRKRRTDPVTHGEVVAAAAGLFAERGFSNTRADDIADAVQIAKPTLYARTPGKWDLLADIVNEVVSALEEYQGKPELDSNIETLRNMFNHHVQAAIRLRDYFRVMLMDQRELPDEHRGVIRARQQHYNRRVERLIEEGIKKGEIAADVNPVVAANTILGVANWTCLWYRDNRSLNADDVAAMSWNLLAAGLVPRQ